MKSPPAALLTLEAQNSLPRRKLHQAFTPQLQAGRTEILWYALQYHMGPSESQMPWIVYSVLQTGGPTNTPWSDPVSVSPPETPLCYLAAKKA